MFTQLPALQKLIRQLQRVPYLASKNIYRIACYFLTSDDKQIEAFCQAILEAKKNIKHCSLCYNWTEHQELCSICLSEKRDKRIICVVETWHDLWALENAGQYLGVYHVLGGALCPLEGIGPDHLTIKQLLVRLTTAEVDELIFATNPTPEGEATASYIHAKMNKIPIKVSRLASGVPIGASLEYMDRVTISKALLGRQPF
jgi:recombination protein RecR